MQNLSLMQTGIEYNRTKRISTDLQKKLYKETQKDAVINNFIKDSINANQEDLSLDMLHNYLIPSKKIDIKEEIEPETAPPKKHNSLKKLCLSTVGLVGGMALLTLGASKLAGNKFKKPEWNSLPDIGRNVTLDDEEEFVTYMMVQNPQIKTFLSAGAFFVYSATAFILKNFVDGALEIFVKKEAAKADYKLQDDLIDVETKVFKGKNQIINSMMRDTASELSSIIEQKSIPTDKTTNSFRGKEEKENTTKKELSDKTKNILLVGTTILSSLLLSILAVKNLKNIDKEIQKNADKLEKQVETILNNNKPEDIIKNKDTLKNIFSVMNFKPQKTKKLLEKAKLPKNEVEDILNTVKERTKVFTQAPTDMGGNPGKIQYSTWVRDPRGHFYNWMMNITSKPLGILAGAMALVMGGTYVGKQAVDSSRKIEVKKYNNEIELNLHKRLVNVELRNFKAKKESAIMPLIEEFKAQAPHKTKEELEEMAQHILYEIKNGAPFVYA